MDIRDRGMGALIAAERPDALVHLAFVLNPIRDEHTMYDIDVNGTDNVLDAASAAGSTAAGRLQHDGLRGLARQPRADHRGATRCEACPPTSTRATRPRSTACASSWAASTQTRDDDRAPHDRLRPNVEQLHPALLDNEPFFVLPDGRDPDWQFVHEDDVVDAISRLLVERRGGIFNLTADGTIKLSEAARIAGVKARKMPLKVYQRMAAASWKLRLPNVEAPPGQIEFLLYPWIASNEKLKAELDWTPRYTSRETFEITMRAKRVGRAGAAVEPALQSVPVG